MYKKLNKKLTRNKSEEIYLKEFDSIRNVRPEYVIFSHGKHFKSYTHTHTLAKKGYRGTWAKSFMQTKIWRSTEYFPGISKDEESMQVNLQNTLALYHLSNSGAHAVATEETQGQLLFSVTSGSHQGVVLPPLRPSGEWVGWGGRMFLVVTMTEGATGMRYQRSGVVKRPSVFHTIKE